jgi:hypothetical protein
MKKKLVLWGVIAGILLFADLQPAQARDAAAIANSSKARIITTAERSSNSTLDKASSCINKIDQLLASGDIDTAISIADRTIHSIRRSSLRCENRLYRLRNSCWATLLDLGADDLAQEVLDFCQQYIDLVKNTKKDAILAINTALCGGIPE